MELGYHVKLCGDNCGKYRNPKDVDEIKIIGDIKFCCSKMEEAWDEGYIGFGDKDQFTNSIKMACVCVYKYAYGGYDGMSINCCPFCGEKIIVKEVKRTTFKHNGKEAITTERDKYIEVEVD